MKYQHFDKTVLPAPNSFRFFVLRSDRDDRCIKSLKWNQPNAGKNDYNRNSTSKCSLSTRGDLRLQQ